MFDFLFFVARLYLCYISEKLIYNSRANWGKKYTFYQEKLMKLRKISIIELLLRLQVFSVFIFVLKSMWYQWILLKNIYHFKYYTDVFELH